MITPRTTALCLFMLLTISLAAKEYAIPTNNKAITATLTPISQGNMITMLKEIAITKVQNYDTGSNPIEEFAKLYMLVDVVIKNKSSRAILLARDAYLENGELFIAPKDYIVFLYNRQKQGILACLSMSGIITGMLGMGTIVTINKGRSNNWQNSEFSQAGVVGCLTALALVGNYFATKWLTTFQRKIKDFLQTAQHSRGPIKRDYRDETTTYKVPAGSTFHDKLLIDLTAVHRAFLVDGYPTSLLYQEVTA